MDEITPYFPYFYSSLIAANTYFMMSKKENRKINDDLKVFFYAGLISSIDCLPILWNQTETLSQKVGLEFKTVNDENSFKAVQLGLSFLGQTIGLYYNVNPFKKKEVSQSYKNNC